MAAWFQGAGEAFEIVKIEGGRNLSLNLDCATALSGTKFNSGEAVQELLTDIVKEHKKVLVFANSRNECDWLYWRLHDKLNVPTYLHYSSLEKTYREKVEDQFEKANRAVCFATSTLELGIDIGDIDAVVMYGAPASTSSFIQRIGRGNRRSNKCIVYGLCREYHIDGTWLGALNDLLLFYTMVDGMQQSELESYTDPTFYSVIVQQSFSLADQFGSVVEEILTEVVYNAENSRASFPNQIFHHQILEHLNSLGYFKYDNSRDTYFPQEKMEQVKKSLQLWGNIASIRHETVIDKHEKIALSQIPQGNAKIGKVFLVAGTPRIVTEISGSKVSTQPLNASDPEMVSYKTFGAPVSFQLAQKAAQLLQSKSIFSLPIEVDDQLNEKIRLFLHRFKSINLCQVVPYEKIEGNYCYYTFGGTWGNELLKLHLNIPTVRVLKADSWRIYTYSPGLLFSNLPTGVDEIKKLVKNNYVAIKQRLQLSEHFDRLPTELRLEEIYSLLELDKLSAWFAQLSQKSPIELK